MRYVEAEREKVNSQQDSEDLPLYMVGGSAMPPIKVLLLVENVLLEMELDSGAAITIISETKYKEQFPGTKLRESSMLLKRYSGERLRVVGEMDIKV